jgi:hypothetical protein
MEVDAEGGVWLSVAESVLDIGERDVEGDQH